MLVQLGDLVLQQIARGQQELAHDIEQAKHELTAAQAMQVRRSE